MSESAATLFAALWPIVNVASFALGACIGSFLNVCIYRIPRGIAVYRPARSFCPHCTQPIAAYDNIPLLSFLLLRARCRRCGGTISPRYVLVEGLVAALFLLLWLKYAPWDGPRVFGLVPVTDWAVVPAYWLMAAGLVLGSFVDLEHLIIPNRVTLGGMAAGLVLSALVPALHRCDGWAEALQASVTGAVAGWVALRVVAILGRWFFRKDAMGLGDVKLLGAIGAFLGWQAVVFTLVVSSFAGSAVGLAMVLLRRRELGSRIPYGPYLALAALLWTLWGEWWWRSYLETIALPGWDVPARTWNPGPARR